MNVFMHPTGRKFSVSGRIYTANNSAGGHIYSYSNGNFTIPKNTVVTFSGGSWSFEGSSISSGYKTTKDGTLNWGFSTGEGITPSASITYTFIFE